MESSENQSNPQEGAQDDALDTAQPPDEVENDAQAEHTSAETLRAPDEVPAPIESAIDKEPAQPSAVAASDPWYPVVGVTDPIATDTILSAVEPVPGAETPVATADSSEVMGSSQEAWASASDGPVWPASAAAPEAADSSEPAVGETPAEQTSATEIPVAVAAGDAIGVSSAVDAPTVVLSEADASVADLAAEPSTDSTAVQAEEPSAASDAEASAAIAQSSPATEIDTPAVVEVATSVTNAPADETEVPETIEAGAAAIGVAGVVEAAAPNEVGDPAASSGAWPEPPTPWADTGAIAAVGEAIAAAKATQPPIPEQPSPETTATPDVSDIPTMVNTSQVEPPQVDATPPPPEAPPAYAPLPQPPAPVGYAAPPQPIASAAVAPQASAPNTTPVIVEAILAFFGIYGVGWLIAGETTIGVALLIAGFVWDAIFVAAAFTVLGLCCVVPLQLIFVALSAFQLNNRLRMRG